MKWRDHQRLTFDICTALDIDVDYCRGIAEASTLPDKEPDYTIECRVYGRRRKRVRCYKRRVRHHHPEALRLAMRLLVEARQAYLAVRGAWSASWVRPLGRALHYVQDYVISPLRGWSIFKLWDEDLHRAIEDEVSRIAIDARSVAAKVLEATVYPHHVMRLASRLKATSNARVAVERAAYATAMILRAFFDPDEPPNLDEVYRRLRLRHYAIVAPLALASIASIVLMPVTFIPLAVAAYMAHKADTRYHEASFDYKWLRGK